MNIEALEGGTQMIILSGTSLGNLTKIQVQNRAINDVKLSINEWHSIIVVPDPNPDAAATLQPFVKFTI